MLAVIYVVPALVMDCIRPACGELRCARAAIYDAPATILEYITPAPVRIAVIAVIAASAPVAEHIAPAPAGIAGPAPVVEYISPAPAVSYAAPLPRATLRQLLWWSVSVQRQQSATQYQIPSNAQVLSPMQHRQR